MTERKNKLWRYVAIAGVVAGATYIIITSIVNERLEDLQFLLQLQISEQQTLLAAISETTARNGADQITEQIVKDCTVTERTQFDQLLGRLDSGLSRAQLVELERLFGRCGSFYSERKSVMVSRLARETEIYEAYVTQFETISDTAESEQFQLTAWKNLVEQEQRQSELFASLVGLQDDIISILLDGGNPQSEEIQNILQEVQQKQETLLVANKQSANIRSELISL